MVAFVLKYPELLGQGEPEFPPILGTGFVVSSDGLVATNDHVVEVFRGVPKPANAHPTDWGIQALVFHLAPEGLMTIPLEVLGIFQGEFERPPQRYYGPKKPDVALVHVTARGLPSVKVAPDPVIVEGLELATAGFPMGTRALVAPGWLHQITPTLQQGIVSAVLPYPGRRFHGFAINVMVQGGASGSPVFDPESGEVVGILYGSLLDRSNGAGSIPLPTNISYVVPSHYLTQFMQKSMQDPALTVSPKLRTLEEIIRTAERVELPARPIKGGQVGDGVRVLRPNTVLLRTSEG